MSVTRALHERYTTARTAQRGVGALSQPFELGALLMEQPRDVRGEGGQHTPDVAHQQRAALRRQTGGAEHGRRQPRVGGVCEGGTRCVGMRVCVEVGPDACELRAGGDVLHDEARGGA